MESNVATIFALLTGILTIINIYYLFGRNYTSIKLNSIIGVLCMITGDAIAMTEEGIPVILGFTLVILGIFLLVCIYKDVMDGKL